MSSLILGKEILGAFRSISTSNLGLIDSADLARIDFAPLSTSALPTPAQFDQLYDYLDHALHEFEQWANDIRTVPQPPFFQGTLFLRRLIGVALSHLAPLRDARFFVYIDEYENLTLLQQRIVNTWIKHSERPLVFNLAMKRNGFKTRRTLGEESLVQTHDYRTVDLEAFDQESEFHLFAAEILLFRLHFGGAPFDDFQPELLRDPAGVEQRSNKEYSARILLLAKRVLPTWTREELTQQIFADSSLHRVLRQRIREALKHRGVSDIAPEHFMDQNSPMPGTVVIPALLARHRLSPEDVVCEFNKYTAGSPSKFQEGPQWVHNLFIACYLDLFASVVRACPLYSGFDTYCRMAKGNLRHFLELCHRAITTLSSEQDWALSARQQAEAARQVSASLLPEVRSFGRLGNDLHSFLLRLGTLFSLSQRRLSQSEPERTHFAIRDGEDSIDESSKRLLSEAVKWSVLFEERQTKAKSIGAPAVIDYVLNPIYAPYFHISYRKGRKLELSGQDFVILSSGTADEFKVRLYAKYRQAWDVPRDQLSRSLPLLALLDDEESQ